MLHIFRSKKFARRTLYGILIVIIPAFVLWGAGSFSDKPALIGTIDKKEIRSDDFAKSLQGIKIELLLTYSDYNVLTNVLRNRSLIARMAWERLIFLISANKHKIKITDRDVLFSLAQHPLFQKNGLFDRWTYNYIIKNTLGMEPRTFEELVRENIEIIVFQNALCKDIVVPEKEIKEHFGTLNDKFDISYFRVDKENFTGSSAPTEEEIENYYTSHVFEFETPQKIGIEYIEIPYSNVEQKKEVANKMGELQLRLEKFPTTFEETAKEHGVYYRKTGPISRDDLLPGTKFSKKVHDIALSMSKDEVSPPVFTGNVSGSAYLMRKIDTTPAQLMAFEEVRETVAEKLVLDKKTFLASEKASSFYEDISSGKISFEEAANSLSAEIRTSRDIDIDGYIDGIGPAEAVIFETTGKDPGSMIPPVTSVKGVFMVKIEKITPAGIDGFAEQKDGITRQIMSRKRKEFLSEWLLKEAPESELARSLDTV